MNLTTTICLCIVASFLAYEHHLLEGKSYSLGNGDTLIVRSIGYDFCPIYCKIDHFHIGHKKGYDCEDDSCNHIVYENRLN